MQDKDITVRDAVEQAKSIPGSIFYEPNGLERAIKRLKNVNRFKHKLMRLIKKESNKADTERRNYDYSRSS